MAHLVGALSPRPKVCRFSSGLGHISRFWVQSPGQDVYKKATNPCFSPCLCASLSQSYEKMSLCKDKKIILQFLIQLFLIILKYPFSHGQSYKECGNHINLLFLRVKKEEMNKYYETKSMNCLRQLVMHSYLRQEFPCLIQGKSPVSPGKPLHMGTWRGTRSFPPNDLPGVNMLVSNAIRNESRCLVANAWYFNTSQWPRPLQSVPLHPTSYISHTV